MKERAMIPFQLKASAGAALLLCSASGVAQEPAHKADSVQGMHGVYLAMPSEADFKTVPIAPACNTIAPLRGDPTKEGSTLLVRMRSGCLVPWHWHHATEELAMLGGTAIAQMKGGKSVELKTGSYSQLPKLHRHRFRCASKEDCYIFVVADAPFDINYVDADDKALTTEQALDRAAKEKIDW
jgi:quercetin dioxygenase-like cupin family protein